MKTAIALLCLLWVAMVESQESAELNETCLDVLTVPVFNNLAVMYGISNGSGLCHVEVEDVLSGGEGSNNVVCSTCQPVINLCASIIEELNQAVRNECVMAAVSSASPACSRATHSYKAYGYGVAMLAVVLVLVTVVGFGLAKLGQHLKGESGGEGKDALSYKLLNLCLTAFGASALLDNTVLHILPQVLDIDASSAIPLGKGCVLLVGLYAFYLLEFVLHSFTGHSHSHGGDEADGDHGNSGPIEVTIPHGACKDDEPGSTIVHPRRGRDEDCTQQRYGSVPHDEKRAEEGAEKEKEREEVESIFGHSGDGKEKPDDVDCRPLSGHGHSHGGGDKGGACGGSPFLLLVLADTVHMFVDGVALGASISQSLTLGLTTSCALLLHELPHVFGDYSILLRMRGGFIKTVVPFVSYMYLVAIVGYFTGASIGLNCVEANKWVLSLSAGFFVYVALVDLLPELINGVPRGMVRLLAISIIGFAFLVTFAIFILFANFQNSINVVL